jgi:hypothetical protein
LGAFYNRKKLQIAENWMQKASYVTFLTALAILVTSSRSISADITSSQQIKVAQKNAADGIAGDKDSNSSSNSSSSTSKDAEASTSSDSKRKAKPSNDGSESDPKEQVHAWFKQYDGVRRDAEMSVPEKFQVHSLFGKLGDEKKLGSEKSEELAKRMMDRYAEAAKKIHDLPELAATAELQKGYEEFFTRSSHLFNDYLSTNKKGNEKTVTKEEVQAKKEELTAFDKKIKAIDAGLRSKYGVRAHRHK